MVEDTTAYPRSGDAGRTITFQLLHNRRLVVTVLILAQAYVCFGYDASIIGGILAMPTFVEKFGSTTINGRTILTASTTSIITATRTSASIPAVFACSYFSKKIGRRKTIWIGCATCLLGTAVQTGSVNVAMITIGLTIANFGYFVMVSMASTLAIEISPPPVRGIVGAISVVASGLAGVLSSGVTWGTYDFSSQLAFRLPLGLQNIWPIVMAITMVWVMDSPTSYLILGDVTTAEKSLGLVRQGYSEEELQQELMTLKLQAHLRREEVDVSWYHIFRGVDLRRTLLATFIGVIQQLSGSIFASVYATVFLKATGSNNPFLLVFALNILALGGSFVGLFLVDTIGRRSLMLLSFLLLFLIDMILGGLGFANPANKGVAQAISAFCLLFGFIFNLGFQPLTWLNASELPTARLRNVTNAFVLMCISLSNLTVTYVIPYITNADAGNLGAKTYLIFAFVMFIGLVITFFYFPEVKGRAPAELDEMFGAALPARKFKSYNCTVVHEVNLRFSHKLDKEEFELVVPARGDGC